VKYTKHNLKAHSAVAALDTHHRLTIYAGSVGQLALGQAAQLAPCLYVSTDVAQHAADGNRGS